MLSADSTHPRLTEEGRRNVFRLIGRDDRQGRMAGDFLVDRRPGRRIAIVHDGSTYGQGLAAQTRLPVARARCRGGALRLLGPAWTTRRNWLTGCSGGYSICSMSAATGPTRRGSSEQCGSEAARLQLVGGDGLGMRRVLGDGRGRWRGGHLHRSPRRLRGPRSCAVLAEFRASALAGCLRARRLCRGPGLGPGGEQGRDDRECCRRQGAALRLASLPPWARSLSTTRAISMARTGNGRSGRMAAMRRCSVTLAMR